MTIKSNVNLRQSLENRANEQPDKDYLHSEIDGRSWTCAAFDKLYSINDNLSSLKTIVPFDDEAENTGDLSVD